MTYELDEREQRARAYDEQQRLDHAHDRRVLAILVGQAVLVVVVTLLIIWL